MSTSSPTVYLVTGANRGIGLGLAKELATRPNAIVFAGARNPAAEALAELSAVHKNVHPMKLTLCDEEDNKAAVAEIEKTAGRLDVVIANAGELHGSASMQFLTSALPISDLREKFEVNTVGMVVLFQAVYKILLASPTGAPVFANISTGSASLARYLPMFNTGYNTSKAAANFLIREIDAQNPTLIAMAISPGWVQTDMGAAGAARAGLPMAPVTVQDSVEGILSRIDGATKEKSSGKFWNFKATSGNPWDIETEEIPW
ncbi:NAD(P)-binding protein [Mycena kentingensis (nom. inval.)]|nr:NAD(P)-binding protein [Mycena kentingensis (nom. inval.)]